MSPRYVSQIVAMASRRVTGSQRRSAVSAVKPACGWCSLKMPTFGTLFASSAGMPRTSHSPLP